MKKVLQIAICLLFVVWTNNFGNLQNAFCFYSCAVQASGTVQTGSLDVSIANLSVYDEEGTPAESLLVNTSKIFSFSVQNEGASQAIYSLDLLLAWDETLPESGKLFVFPDYFDDYQILSMIYEDDYSYALIGHDDDVTELQLSSGASQSGVERTVDIATLNSGQSTDYAFRLFFFADDEVLGGAELYHNIDVELIISVRADVQTFRTAWEMAEQDYFRVTSMLDFVYPVITEVGGARTFFAGQVGQIDLTSFAVADDEVDGNLTDYIQISPASVPATAGEHEITYTVTNSTGVTSRLVITFVVWDFSKIVSGDYHTLALTSHGKIYSWGGNYEGQLGLGKGVSANAPKLVAIDNAVDVAVGRVSSYALTADGSLYAWGDNSSGQLGIGEVSDPKYLPVQVQLPNGLRFSAISAGYMSAGAVTDSGDVYTWGSGESGVLGTGNANNVTSPSKLSISGISMLSLGRLSGAAVGQDGSLYTWGGNHYGQLGNGQSPSTQIKLPNKVPYFTNNKITVQSVAVGSFHMAAISNSGKLYTWGFGAEGELGNGQTSNFNTPQPINLPNAKKVVCSTSFTGVITTDGYAYLFGSNDSGQLGNGTTSDHRTPTLLDGVSGITDISLGVSFSLVLDGIKVLGSGYGGSGSLGTGNNSNTTTPTPWLYTPPAPQ